MSESNKPAPRPVSASGAAELASANAQIASGKLEIHSLNEQLAASNAQLRAMGGELTSATHDLSSMLTGSNIAALFIDADLRVRSFSSSVQDLFAILPSDIGRPLSEIGRRFTDADLETDLRDAMEAGLPIEKEVGDGNARWHLRRVFPHRVQENRIEGAVITFVDITRQRLAERAQRDINETHRLIVQAMKEYAIIILDTEGHVTSWSSGATRMLGYSEPEMLGRFIGLIFTPEDRSAGLPEREMRRAKTEGEGIEEGWRLRRDGSRVWASGHVTAMHDEKGGLKGYVKIVRDNTDRKAAEEKIQEARRSAEAANEAKDQFLATVSHELKTPLSTMLLWCQLINSGNCTPEQMREAMESIHWSAEAQKRLIDDLLDTSRIAAGKLRLNIQETDVAATIRAAVQASQPSAKLKGIRIVEHIERHLGFANADPDRLQQIAWNLLANAIKFTPDAGQIEVMLSHRAGEGYVLQVRDNGIGMDSELIPRLFTRFSQSENPRTRLHDGLGLGLAIARQLAEMHEGGTIEAESAGKGMGSTFTVRLPLRRTPTDAKLRGVARSPVGTELRGVNVLLVEDNVQTRRALKAALARIGANVASANDANSALKALAELHPDVILSDIGMPSMDGYLFMERVREIEESQNLKRVPAIAVSAFGAEGDVARAMASGFQAHVSKPVRVEELVKVILDLARPASMPG